MLRTRRRIGFLSTVCLTWAAASAPALAAPADAAPGAGQAGEAGEAGEAVEVDGSSADADEAAAAPAPSEAGAQSSGTASLDASGPAAAAAAGSAAKGSGMKGRFGVMGTRTITGLNGIGLRFYPIDLLSIGLTGGFALFTHDEANEQGEFTQKNRVGLAGGGPQVFVWPVRGSRNSVVSADFGVGVRGLVYVGFTGANQDDATDKLNDPLEYDIEIPVTTQLFVGDRVAIAPEFGLAIRIIPGSREPDDMGNVDENPGTGVGSRLGTTDGPGVGVELGSSSGVFLGLNVGYYFGGKKR